MALRIVPTIKQGKVLQIFLSFDNPIPLPEFSELLKTINRQLRSRGGNQVKKTECIKYPIYSNGEMIAVIEKYSNGKTVRTYV